MTLLLLAAGFATRLEPISFKCPKHLIPIGTKKVLLDVFVDTYEEYFDKFSRIVLITNDVFLNRFENWAQKQKFEIDVISDGVKNKSGKKGAVGDFLLAIKKASINDDVLICAPDFIPTELNLSEFIKYSASGDSVIMTKIENNVNKIKAGSCLKLDGCSQVIEFCEKPKEPFSNIYGIPYYIVQNKDISLIQDIPRSNWDNMGQIPALLSKKSKIFAFNYSGKCIHLTNLDDLEKLKKSY